MNNNILVIVITYYPEENLLRKNINKYENYVEEILIWENTPQNDAPSYRFIDSPKIKYVGNGTNSGIPIALNYAWKYAVENKYGYLLTMDQDSEWDNFSLFLDNTIKNPNSPKGIWGPYINYDGRFSNKIFEEKLLITSGMLQSVDVINTIGGWNEYFKIDAVDVDYCYKAREMGILSYRIKGCKLIQQYGNPETGHFLNKRFPIKNYNPKRLYHIYKNHIIVIRKYQNTQMLKKHFIDYWIKENIKYIVFGEKNKLEKLYSICRGILSGFLQKI